MQRRIAVVLTGVMLLSIFGGVVPASGDAACEVVAASENDRETREAPDYVYYDYPVEKTKETAELDSDYRDSQHILYTLNENTHTAKVGNLDPCGYDGSNDGVCIIPEQVSYAGEIYPVTSIGTSAFRDIKSLAVIVLPDTVTRIGYYAFMDTNLQYMYIGAGYQNYATEIFMDVYTLKEIRVSPRNQTFQDIEGVLYSADGRVLIKNPSRSDSRGLAEYTVPEGVTWILDEAFRGSRYYKVTLPSSVTEIGDKAFMSSNIDEIDLSHVSHIGAYALGNCQNLKSVTLPSDICRYDQDWLYNAGVRSILFRKNMNGENSSGVYALKNLQFAAFEDGIRVIMENECYNCPLLSQVVIPDGVTKIFAKAFGKCSNLHRIYIPASVTVIEEGVLEDTDAVIYGYAGSTAETYAGAHDMEFVDVSGHDHTDLAAQTIYEDNRCRIKADACMQCGYARNIRRITKRYLDAQDAYAFAIDRVNKVWSLDDGNQDANGLIYTIPAGTEAYMEVSSKNYKMSYADVVIPKSVQKDGMIYTVSAIPAGLFYNNQTVKSVVMTDYIKRIPKNAFAKSTVEYIYIGRDVAAIDPTAFQNCKNIRQIYVSHANMDFYVKDNVLYQSDGTVICDYAESGDSVVPSVSEEEETTENITVEPGSIEHEYPVAQTKQVVELDENYQDSYGMAYQLSEQDHTAIMGPEKQLTTDSIKMDTYVIPETVSYDGVQYTVTGIAGHAFSKTGITSLNTLVIPDTVTTIPNWSFNLSRIKYLYIGAGLGINAVGDLYRITGLREIRLSEENPYLKEQGGILYSADMKTLLLAPASLNGAAGGTCVLPDGVERIAVNAFRESHYYEVVLPASLTQIDEYAFADSSIRNIDLTYVTQMGRYAFVNCEYMRTVTMPAGKYTCTRPFTDPKIGAFLVTKGYTYQSKAEICDKSPYVKVLAIESGSTRLGEDCVIRGNSLELVIIPDSVTTIEKNTFTKCPKLKHVYIPPSVLEIQQGAFDAGIIIYGIAGTAAEAFADENQLQFVDVSDHDHDHLDRVTIYEDSYMQMTALFCEACGYGCEVQQEIRQNVTIPDGTNGAYPFQLDKTKQKVRLDANDMDDQGVKYGCGYVSNASVYDYYDNFGSEHVVIPEIIINSAGEDYLVKRVSQDAFRNKKNIVSLVLPDTVMEISGYSVYAPNLQYMYLGESLSLAGDDYINTCKNFRQLWLSPNNVTLYVKDDKLYSFPDDVERADWSSKTPATAASTGTQEESSESTASTGTGSDVTGTQTENSESTASTGTGSDVTGTRTETPESTAATGTGSASADIGEDRTEPAAGTQPGTKTTAVRQPADANAGAQDNAQVIATVRKPQLSLQNGKRVVIAWKAVDSADRYEIWRSRMKSGRYSRIGTVKQGKTSYTDSKVKAYQKYYYKVRAVAGSGTNTRKGGYSVASKVTVTGQGRPQLQVQARQRAGVRYLQLTLKHTDGKCIELQVKKKGGKYQKIRLVSENLSRYRGQLQIGYRPNGTYMWLRIRTYTKVKNKKYYSQWSKPVQVK